MEMVQRKFYLPKQTYNRMQIIARQQEKTISEVLRDLVERGIDTEQKGPSRSIQALRNISEMAEKENWTGPADLAINHNKYFAEAWEEQNRSKFKNNK